MSRKGRIVVGMSGGVDSSVAAWLLKEQGYEVTGLFMKNWEDDDDSEFCSSRQDWLDAVSVADRLGIEIEAVNFATEYKERVFSEFLREYQAGRTPNPDVLCNSEIKFKAFLDYALQMGASGIATGHYARIGKNEASTSGDEFLLLKALDRTKDQSYFLHRLNQQQLARTQFPLGNLLKTEVRQTAHRLGLANHAKKDSTGICFIGERPFREFLNRYLPTQPGPIKNLQGQVIGQHIGLSFYTLGQRQGLGIGGIKNSELGAPWYVVAKELQSNSLIVVQGMQHPALWRLRLRAEQASWIAGRPPQQLTLSAKIRYRQHDATCKLNSQQDDSFDLKFRQRQWAITSGQSAVLYDGDICLGGGIIVNQEITDVNA